MSKAKPRVKLSDLRILEKLNEHIQRYDVRGGYALREVASDVLDSGYYRDELDGLIRARLLTVVKYKRCEADRWLWENRGHRPLCGSSWSVNLTQRAMLALWPDRSTLTTGGTDDR